MRHRWPPGLILAAFLVVPILELYVILRVADVIGGWQTLALLIAESIFGTWLVRREGRRTWAALQAALAGARPITRELTDGALVVIGGTLLLTPGFLSDIVGFFLLLPPTRPIARRLVARWLTRRAVGVRARARPDPWARSSAPQVMDGEVVDRRED